MIDAIHPYKVGDQVLIYSNRPGRVIPAKWAAVQKVTKTQITADGVRFSVDKTGYGCEYGSSLWHAKTCQTATPERIAANQRLIDTQKAVGACRSAAELLRNAEGDAAIHLASILPAELKVTK